MVTPQLYLVCLLLVLPCFSFKLNHKILSIQPQAARAPTHVKLSLQSSVQQRPDHLLFTDACTLEGGGYYLNGKSYSQFRWTPKERYRYGAKNSTPLEKTDIRMLEFVAAVAAIYTERKRLQNSCVELRIDNSGASSWLHRRNMKHLWGQGWMRLLNSVCEDYNIVINPLTITGAENPVADALSRFKKLKGNHSTVLQGMECMTNSCPTPEWREEIWNERYDYVPKKHKGGVHGKDGCTRFDHANS